MTYCMRCNDSDCAGDHAGIYECENKATRAALVAEAAAWRGRCEAAERAAFALRAQVDAATVSVIDELAWRTATGCATPMDAAVRIRVLLDAANGKGLASDEEFLRSIATNTKHGPRGMGGPGDCSPGCVKCDAEIRLRVLREARRPT